jgi:hypothetical protein
MAHVNARLRNYSNKGKDYGGSLSSTKEATERHCLQPQKSAHGSSLRRSTLPAGPYLLWPRNGVQPASNVARRCC